MNEYLVLVSSPWSPFPVASRVIAKNKEHAVLVAGEALSNNGYSNNIQDMEEIKVKWMKRL